MAAIGVCAPAAAESFDWSNTGLSSLTNFPNGTVVAGSDGNVLTTTYSADVSGGSFDPAYGSDYLSYYSGQVGNDSGVLLAGFDNSSYDPDDKLTILLTLAEARAGVSFSVSDIDKGSFQDAIEIEYDTGNGTWVNVAANTSLYSLGSVVQRTNNSTVDGWVGTGSSDTGGTNGNININIGAITVKRIRIRYFSYSGSSWSNPSSQFLGVSDISYNPRQADLSMTKTVSSSSPNSGNNITYTLSLTAAAGSYTSTNVTVRDQLPSGTSFVSAAGYGTYNSTTGIWLVPSIAAGETRQLTITALVTANSGTTVTNAAQVQTAPFSDPDSTPGNNATGEDDYATATFTATAPVLYNCPQGSTSTGSGYANGGTGQYQNQIFWFDWSCGSTTTFPVGSTINKSWNAGDGLIITGQVTNIANGALSSYSTGDWTGDRLDNMYPGVNPIGLGGSNGADPSFRITYSATLNGVSVPLRYVIADAETTDVGGETMTMTTTGSAWAKVEEDNNINETLAGTTASWTGGSGTGSIVLETTGNTVQLKGTILNNGGQFIAYGIITPFDYSDAPLAGKNYGSASHRTVSGYSLGASFTTEQAAFDSPTASGDVDNAASITSLNQNQAVPLTVVVQGRGYLSLWIDYNSDGDFADAGEKVVTDVVDGGAGDLDGTVNGTISLNITAPSGSATSATFARMRYSSRTGAPSSGQYGFGEVEDYMISIVNAQLSVTKISWPVSDGLSGSDPKAIPGATIRYCITIANSGTGTATSVVATDNIPTTLTYQPGTIKSGTTCGGATTAEDDDAAGADESDPFGASISGETLVGRANTLSPGANFSLVFDTVIK